MNAESRPGKVATMMMLQCYVCLLLRLAGELRDLGKRGLAGERFEKVFRIEAKVNT